MVEDGWHTFSTFSDCSKMVQDINSKFMKYSFYYINSLPNGENPSSLQTTAASCASHSLSQTVPHVLLKHISTLPSYMFVPLTSRRPQGKSVGSVVVVGQRYVS